jgi:hypothetical protein
MLLWHIDGTEFAQGAASYFYRPASAKETSDRILVNIELDGQSTTAVVDTAGHWLVCDPEIAASIAFDPNYALAKSELEVRGRRLIGQLYRVNLKLVATSGRDLTIEVTTFVPTGHSETIWVEELKLPTFLGMTGCLEGLRFAVDPFEEVFYFGSP